MNEYKTPQSEIIEKLSKKDEINKSNKKKKKTLIIITLIFGGIGVVGSIDKDTHIIGSLMVGLFTSLLSGIPLLFFYVFTKKR